MNGSLCSVIIPPEIVVSNAEATEVLHDIRKKKINVFRLVDEEVNIHRAQTEHRDRRTGCVKLKIMLAIEIAVN